MNKKILLLLPLFLLSGCMSWLAGVDTGGSSYEPAAAPPYIPEAAPSGTSCANDPNHNNSSTPGECVTPM